MYNPENTVEMLWREAAAELAQAGPERWAQIREEYVRDAVRELDSPEHGGYVAEDSALTHPADRIETHEIKKAFKRLHQRGEIVKVEPIGGGLIYRLV